jgi:hypothetical protein
MQYRNALHGVISMEGVFFCPARLFALYFDVADVTI